MVSFKISRYFSHHFLIHTLNLNISLPPVIFQFLNCFSFFTFLLSRCPSVLSVTDLPTVKGKPSGSFPWISKPNDSLFCLSLILHNGYFWFWLSYPLSCTSTFAFHIHFDTKFLKILDFQNWIRFLNYPILFKSKQSVQILYLDLNAELLCNLSTKSISEIIPKSMSS